MTITDTIIAIVIIFMTTNGVYEGFFRTLIWPLSLLITYLVAWALFLASGNLIICVIIGVIMPFLLRWVMHLLLSQFPSYENRASLPQLVRLGGALVNFTWSSIVALAIVLLLAFIPIDRFGLGDITSDVLRSQAFQFMRPLVLPKKATTSTTLSKEQKEDPSCPLCTDDDDEAKALAADPAIQTLLNDPRIMAISNDPALQKTLQSGNTAQILADPAIQALLTDPQFIMHAMKAYATIRSRSIE